jgi:hypothetical protein
LSKTAFWLVPVIGSFETYNQALTKYSLSLTHQLFAFPIARDYKNDYKKEEVRKEPKASHVLFKSLVITDKSILLTEMINDWIDPLLKTPWPSIRSQDHQ